jgi:serine/threonine protein kinase
LIGLTILNNLEPKISHSSVSDQSALEICNAELGPGAIIGGQFEVLTKLGSGGMSSVYRCLDMFVERTVAVKVLFADCVNNPKALSRFRREAKAIAKLDHANIVRLHSFNFDLSSPYIVMEHIEGITLADLIETNGPLDVEQVFRLADQLCGALQYAHANGVIHRDLKPSNIIIERFDSRHVQAKILDFGIAKMVDDTTPGATSTGELFGTPAYMSPEQALGKSVDRRSDQYSLGCVLFECLTGTPPFVGSGQLSVLMQHVQSDAPSLEESTFSARAFPPQIQPVIDKMLAKFPEERYDSMSEVFENLVDEPTESEFAVVSFSNLIGKAGQESARKQTNFEPASSVSNLPFWAGLAVGAAAFLVIGASILAIYFGFSSQNMPTETKAHDEDLMAEHILGGIDISKAMRASLENQIKQDRQRIDLIVEDKTVTDRGLNALIGARSIQNLNLNYCDKVGDEGISKTWHLPLRTLHLKETAITNAALKGIADHFPNLTGLGLQQTAINDEGIRYLTPLTNLFILDLKFTEVAKSASVISKFSRLRVLMVDHTKFDFADLHLTDLTRITANAVPLNNKAFLGILRNKKLELLSLNQTNITDEQLWQLASLKNLRTLHIQDCPNVTAFAVARFQRALPGCVVQTADDFENQRQEILGRWAK